jgi:hypothetical protein
MNHKVFLTGILFLLVFLFGFWLSRAGKPYNSIIFNVHKLIGLATGIFLIMMVFQAYKVTSFSLVEVVTIVTTVLIFVGLVAAGGLLSIDAAGDLGDIGQSTLTAISVIHKALPYFAVLSTAATLYLLLVSKV